MQWNYIRYKLDENILWLLISICHHDSLSVQFLIILIISLSNYLSYIIIMISPITETFMPMAILIEQRISGSWTS